HEFAVRVNSRHNSSMLPPLPILGSYPTAHMLQPVGDNPSPVRTFPGKECTCQAPVPKQESCLAAVVLASVHRSARTKSPLGASPRNTAATSAKRPLCWSATSRLPAPQCEAPSKR